MSLGVLSAPAGAAEETGPSGAAGPAAAWYTPYVETCAQAGLTARSEAGPLSPDQIVSGPGALVLLMELHALLNGASTDFPPPPENWGWARLTFADGQSLLLHSAWLDYGGSSMGCGYTLDLFHLPAEDSACLLDHLGESALLTDLATGAEDAIESLSVFNEDETGITTLVLWNTQEIPGFYFGRWQAAWSGPAAWYSVQQGLSEEPGISWLFVGNANGWQPNRKELAIALSAVAGPLPAVNVIGDLPDLNRRWDRDLYTLYEAGILTGVDAYGTFSDREVTWAEAAAMVARVLSPQLRVRFTPAPKPRRA